MTKENFEMIESTFIRVIDEVNKAQTVAGKQDAMSTAVHALIDLQINRSRLITE
jgi:hypothetical protein